jgi:mannitol/fructose-specific phosphotransferase system IIA component (Ntr-type)
LLLTELLTPDRVRIPLLGAGKPELIEELVSVLVADGSIGEPAEVLRAVLDREEVLSTGIGNGVAIPHGKSEGVSSLVLAAGVTSRPVDFEALDGDPVSLLFLLVGPGAAAGDHVKALSRISRLLRRDRFRRRLIAAADAATFYSVIAEAEEP